MSIPSLMVSRYDRWTPEVRDKITEKLDAALPDTAYHVPTTAVIHDLGKDLRRRLGGEISVEIDARPTEVATAGERAQRAVEAREELATVQRLVDAGPQQSAWGVQATLLALGENRVATLVVDDMFARPGARCRDCGALLEAAQDACPHCGGVTGDINEDIVELAIEQTLNEDGAFEMVRSALARQLLTKIGPMAALLRW